MSGYYLRDFITLDVDDPRMPIHLFAGPLVGTKSPTSGRITVMSRSPLTGTVGDASVGGALGTQMKRAGWDGIIITGQSRRWVGIEISDDRVEVCDGSSLFGLPVHRAMGALEGKGSVALIGPAAENGVRFANLMVDRHFTAGRGGLGLCFAAKKLKYVSIKGTETVPVFDRDALKRAREDIFRLIAASPVLLGEHGIQKLGTPALFDLMHSRRMMPTLNFKKTFFPVARSLNAQALSKQYRPQNTGCLGCHIQCKKKSGDGQPLPEFETLSHFTALLGNEDLETAVRANILCNELGMDTISAAATIACYQEATGTEMSPERILELLEDIGRGRGVGEQLKEGSRRYADRVKRPELSMSVKGQELPAYDPRGAYGMALSYATSTRGGCHLRAYPISHEILRKPVATDRFSFSGKARIIKISEDLNAIIDSLTACKFVFFACTLEEYAKAFQAVTGLETTTHDLSEIGERIYYHERIMNAENGFDSADDDLPPRFFREAGTTGPSFEVPPIDREAFLLCRAAYYKVRGLDEQGMPTKEKALQLGLKWNS